MFGLACPAFALPASDARESERLATVWLALAAHMLHDKKMDAGALDVRGLEVRPRCRRWQIVRLSIL